MKKVTIIVPIYNMEKYLVDCLESILNQSYRELEIILVDDGSTDNSKNIIEKYKKVDTRIISAYQKNMGAPAARNLGIDMANGEYIMFFDSDDVLEKDGIKKLVGNVKDADLIVGNNFEIDENEKRLNKKEEFRQDEVLDSDKLKKAIFFNPLPGNKLFLTKVIKDNNIKFANLKIGQDLDFYLRYLLYCKKIKVTKDYIFNYRRTNNSISRTYSFKIFNIVNTLKNIEEAYKDRSDVLIDYIPILKLIHYNGQIAKVPYFENKIDRKIIVLFFQKYEKEIKYNKRSDVFKKYKKIYYEFKIKVHLKAIYESNLFSRFFKWLHKNYKNKGGKRNV